MLPPIIRHLVQASALTLAAAFQSSCSHPSYGLYYSYKELPPQAPTSPLPKGKTPQVLYARDPEALTRRYEQAGYVVIGVAQTVQPKIPYGAVAAFAASKGASVVITTNHFERTDIEKRVRPVTESYTTYHSGTVSGNSYGGTTYTVRPTYGYGPSYTVTSSPFLSTPSYSYSGSSTTYRTRMQEYTVAIDKYAQYFFFLAPKA